jgi:ubiquitin-protein ligase
MITSTNTSTKNQDFPEFDYDVIKNNLCSLQTFQRVLAEIKNLNDDFFTLRTIIKETEFVGVLHFIQYPADGALSDKPIFGRIIITNTYPETAPIVHIFTRTERFNVDVYNSYCYDLKSLHSSACFDILNAGYGGTWQKDFTISALLASLLQSIVSIDVPQQYGSPIKEFVTMEKLDTITESVKHTFNKYRKYIPEGRLIKKTDPVTIDTVNFKFDKPIFSTETETTVKSKPFTLGTMNSSSMSIGIDCSDLAKNKSTVFSIVMTTNPADLTGKKKDTILFRNGVTGTAAKKLANKETLWFYHGIPLNENCIKLVVTVTSTQFTICYEQNGFYYIHGDYPVAYFREPELSDKQFYLCLYLKNKNRGHASEIKLFNTKVGLIQNTDDFEIV